MIPSFQNERNNTYTVRNWLFKVVIKIIVLRFKFSLSKGHACTIYVEVTLVWQETDQSSPLSSLSSFQIFIRLHIFFTR